MFVVLHRTPTESDGAEENRAGSRNVFFMRVLMSVAAAAGSWARASREFQRGVEVMSVSAARVMAIEIGENKRRRKGREISLVKFSVKLFHQKRLC